MNAFTLEAGSLAASFDKACSRLEQMHFADALWNRQLEVWSPDAAVQKKIATRLGWLGALDFVRPHLPRLREVADLVARAGASEIVLLGMGGSSLAPEVLRQVLGIAEGRPNFRMLDSTDPDAVNRAMANAATSWFVLASKSGSTIEPNVMAAEAQRRLREAGHEWNTRFIAITDEGTLLHRRATEERMREVFVNPSDIGGRYSALSFFGMVPAALMGADLDRLLASADDMMAACRQPSVHDNPGLALGAFMAAGALSGRDKLTLLLPSRLESFGLWVEQLVAESTGKHGKGVVPIAGESGEAHFGSDRVAVVVRLGNEGPAASLLDAARAAGLPMLTLDVPDVLAIGAEFLRWEVGTAAAGVLLDINPFDEPNVQQAKDATRALLEEYTQRGRLPIPEAHATLGGVRLTLSEAAQQALEGEAADTFLGVLRPSDYFGVLAYLPPDSGGPDDSRAASVDRPTSFHEALHLFRMTVGKETGCATMFGYGPRYLHSTGQLHKGGANNGVFVIVTAEPDQDLAIPGEPFSFGVLEMAQAIGDFQSLARTNRRALHIHLPRRDPALIRQITQTLLDRAGRPRQ